MAESIKTLRKRIEDLERKRSAERHPSLLPMADLSVLSLEELDQLITIAERYKRPPGSIVDVLLLDSEDAALLEAVGKKIRQAENLKTCS